MQQNKRHNNKMMMMKNDVEDATRRWKQFERCIKNHNKNHIKDATG